MPLKNWYSIHATCSKSSLKHSIPFCGTFSKFKTQFYCISFVLLKCPHVQIAFLKFTSCDNQVLVGCILIPVVAVPLDLKSWKLVSHLIRCIAIKYNFKCLYKKFCKLIEGISKVLKKVKLVGWLVGWFMFYGISTLVGHLTQNSVSIYIYIYIQPKIS